MKRTVDYREHLLKRLRDPKEAAAYLNAALEDEDPHVFLIAIKDVADARGGLRKVAEKSSLSRESLYRSLSSRGNPRLSSLQAVLGAVGLHLSVSPDRPRKRA